MSKPVSVLSNGAMYHYIVCPEYDSSSGSYYLKDKSVNVNLTDVTNVPTIFSDDYVFKNETYQCFTLGAINSNGVPHQIVANRDCELNFALIASGAPGGTSGNSSNKSSGPGGNAGTVITGKINMKKNERIFSTPYIDNSSTNSRICVDTIKYLGEEKDTTVIGGDTRTKQDGDKPITSQNASFYGNISGNDISITAGGAYWPVASKSTNVTIGPSYNHPEIPTLPTTISGTGDIDVTNLNPSLTVSISRSNDYLSYNIHKSRCGGLTRYNQDFSGYDENKNEVKIYPSFGLSSGYYSESITSIVYDSFYILGKYYQLPCGGAGGGGNPYYYYANPHSDLTQLYNSSVISYTGLPTQSIAASGMGGGGFGNTIYQHQYRVIDAWLPGAGGGGSYQENRNALYSNGYGGQGVMICWIKQ